MDSAELVRLVMARYSTDSPTELARHLKMDYSGPGQISRWLAGRNKPNFDQTLMLLRAAGLLAEEPDLSRPVELETEALDQALLSLGAAVGALERLLGRAGQEASVRKRGGRSAS